MKTLKTVYSSNLVEMDIVDTSATSYGDGEALRIITHDWLDGDIDTVQPLNKKTIDALLKLDDWNDDPKFYQALGRLYKHVPQSSNEPTQPTITSELQTKETR